MSCQELVSTDEAIPRLSHPFQNQQNYTLPIHQRYVQSSPNGTENPGLPFEFTTAMATSSTAFMNKGNTLPTQTIAPSSMANAIPSSDYKSSTLDIALCNINPGNSYSSPNTSDRFSGISGQYASVRAQLSNAVPYSTTILSDCTSSIKDVTLASIGVDKDSCMKTVSSQASIVAGQSSEQTCLINSNLPCGNALIPEQMVNNAMNVGSHMRDASGNCAIEERNSSRLDCGQNEKETMNDLYEADTEDEVDSNDVFAQYSLPDNRAHKDQSTGNVGVKNQIQDEFNDFNAEDEDSKEDDYEDTDDGSDSDTDIVDEGDVENADNTEGLSAEAMEHLTRLRSRMSSTAGGREDVNRYFEALISYDDGVPQDKPLPEGDEEWTLPENQGKKRSPKMKNNRKGSPKKAHKCQICARIFYQAKQLERHLAIHIKPKKFIIPPSKLPPNVKLPMPRSLTCETCGKVFKRTAHLNRHRFIHTGEKPHVCDICGDRFSRPDKMRLHRKIHDKNRLFKCKVCNEQFASNKLLKIHRKTHKTEAKLYACDVCGKNFTVYARLHRHRMIHSGKKPFLCEICGDRFTQSTDLQRHRIIHTGVKAHLCHTCGKKFYHAAHLRRHVKIHETNKPYICLICGGQFARSDILKRHEKIHTGEKEYACGQCGKLFTRSSHLQRHKLTHEGKPAPVYKCSFCPLQFSSNDRMKQHVKLHHPETYSNRPLGDSNIVARDCSATPEQSHAASPCQRSTSSVVMTPNQSRLNSPGARSQCSEPDVQINKQFNFPSTSVNQQFFNHHLGLQPQLFQSNNPRFDCMICGEHFPNGHMLELHYTVHTNMDRPLDHSQFMSTSHNRHMDFNRRHSEVYRCETCGERFSDLSHFQIHCLMHSGEFSDNFSRPLAPFASPHFQNPVFPSDKSRSGSIDGFKPLLGPIPQNLTMNTPINPSCERSKNIPDTFTRALHQHQTCSSPDFPFSLSSSSHPLESCRQSGMIPSTESPINTSTETLPTNLNLHGQIVKEANVTKKPVSIMNNLKQRKRPRLVEAVPNKDQTSETVGYTLDGQPVLNPDVNVGRNKSDQKSYKCGTCFQVFESPQDRIEHVKIHIADLEKLNSCQLCEEKFTNESDLQIHVKNAHPSISKQEPLVQEVDCYSPSVSVSSSDIVPVSMVPNTSSIDVTYQCIDCGLTFSTDSALHKHSKCHLRPEVPGVKSKDYACDVCFKSFLRPHHLSRHKLIHTGVKPYKCDHCEMAFARSDKLKEHLSKIHGQCYVPPKKEVKCIKCQIVFGTKADLKDHNKVQHPKCIRCDICNKTFTKKDHLKRHRRTHSKHRSPSKNQLNICEYCNNEFRSEYELNEHVRHIHNDQQTFQCSLCQAKFVSDTDLNLHHSLTHDVIPSNGDIIIPFNIDDIPDADVGDEKDEETEEEEASCEEKLQPPDPVPQELVKPPPPPEEVLNCDLCGMMFRGATLLLRHKRREHKSSLNEKCTCETCHKDFNSQAQLKRHRKTHSGDKPFMCDECGDSFSRSSHLVRHKVRHTGRREFKCDQCSAEFSRSDHLLCHKRTHSGNKPFVCDICGLQFASGQGLKGHMTSHTGEKPYACRHCGEKFSRNSHLVRHRAQMHNDGQTHSCDICGKNFTRRDQLKRHEKTHSGDRPHVCQTCGKAFARPPLLIRHEKTHEKLPVSNSQPSLEAQLPSSQPAAQPSILHHQSLQQHLQHSSLQHQAAAQQHHQVQPAPPPTQQAAASSLAPCLGQMGVGRLPIAMMDCWSKWSEYHHPGPGGPPQFPFSGSILQAAINASHI